MKPLLMASSLVAAAMVVQPAWAEPAEVDGSTTPRPSPHVERPRFESGLTVGPDYSRLFQMPMTGLEATLAAGARVAPLGACSGEVTFARERSDAGLVATRLEIGGSTQVVLFNHFRIGAGPQLLYFALERVSAGGGTLDKLGAGAHLLATLDVVRIDGHAIEIALRPEANLIGGTTLLAWSASAGFRW